MYQRWLGFKMLRTLDIKGYQFQWLLIQLLGIDFPEVCTIINFDFPTSTSDYLHRAGRAGRAGRKGFVYSFYHSKEQKIIEALRQANETQQPIKIDESAYSKINKESIEEVRKQERTKRKNAKFIKQGTRRTANRKSRRLLITNRYITNYRQTLSAKNFSDKGIVQSVYIEISIFLCNNKKILNDNRTTLMLKNIPRFMSPQDVKFLLNKDFKG